MLLEAIFVWLSEQYQTGALLLAGQLVFSIIIMQFFLLPALVEWTMPEPRPTINVSHLNRETGERKHLNIPDYNDDRGYRWNTPSFSDVLAAKLQRPDDLPLTHDVEVSLVFDRMYLKNFLNQSAWSANRRMRMLGGSPVWSVYFMELPQHESELRQWRLPCATLGSIPTLRQVTIEPLRRYIDRAASILLENLRQVTHLVLLASFAQDEDDEQVLDELARSVRGLSSLTFLQLDDVTCSNSLTILSAVKYIPSLQEISISCESNMAVSTKISTCLARFLQDSTLSSISLRQLHFATKSSCRQVCYGIAHSSVKSISVSHIKFGDAARFAHALSKSPYLTRLHVSCWADQASLPEFLLNLAQKLPQMKLEVLDLVHLCQRMHSETEDEGMRSMMEPVLPALILAAAQCSTLVELRLPYAQVTDELDGALASLMESSYSQLQSLFMGGCLRRALDVDSRLRYWRFLEALKGNVSIQEVVLNYRQSGFYPGPCCADLKREVAMVTRLNVAGRKYLADEPTQLKGLDVLDKVSDDMDCLYFHLREAPSLVNCT
jgi:hypothetical protein